MLTLLQFLSGFSKLLQSCVTVSPDPIGRMGLPKQLITTLVAVLTLKDTEGLGQNTTESFILI